jgi:N-methylhydantoinase B
MTNTLNTPIEVLELDFPLRIRRYRLRDGSGGAGRHRGGDGLVREFEFLAPATVTLLTERRHHAPWGLNGGAPGARGVNRYGAKTLPGKLTLAVGAGDTLVLETPGGGGWGRPAD